MGKKSRKPKNNKQNENEPYKPLGPNDLFENPMAKAALASLSPEEKEKYKIIGEHLYNRVDFTNSKVLDTTPEEMNEALRYIEAQLKSGLHPSMLEENEKALLVEFYGKEWYLKWDYVKDDLEYLVSLR